MNNSRGGALLLVMAISAIIAAVIPIVMMMLNSSLARQAQRSGRERYTEMVMSLRQQLEDPLLCPQLLTGVRIPNNLNQRQSIALNWSFADTPGPIGRGWKSADNMVEIEDVVVRRTGPIFNQPRFKFSGTERIYRTVPFRVYVMQKNLKVNLEDNPFEQILSPEQVPMMDHKELMIRLYANVDASGNVVTCHGANSSASACEATGGAFNHFKSGPPYCDPDTSCFNSKDGLVASGAECAKTPYPFSAKEVGVINGQRRYLCSYCFHDIK